MKILLAISIVLNLALGILAYSLHQGAVELDKVLARCHNRELILAQEAGKCQENDDKNDPKVLIPIIGKVPREESK